MSWFWSPDAQPLGGSSPGSNAYIASGGLQFAGSSDAPKGYVYLPTGGLAWSGKADGLGIILHKSYQYVAGGGLVFSGTALLPRTWDTVAFPPASWDTDPNFGRGF